MARRETVGTAYILMRADGTLLEGDMRRAAEKGARGSAAQYREAFKDALLKEDENLVERMRTSLARAVSSSDFDAFRKQYGTIGDTVRGVTVDIDKLREQNRLTAEQWKRAGAALRRWEINENKRMHAEAMRTERSFDEERLRNTARMLTRMQTLYAEADRSGNWGILQKKGEDFNETLRRVTRELTVYKDAINMTDEEHRRATEGITDWGRAMQKAHEDSADSFVKMRQKVSEAELNKMGRDIATALAHDDWSKFKTDTETSREAVERFSTRIREDLGPALRMTDDDMRDVEASMRRWSGAMDEASRRAYDHEVAQRRMRDGIRDAGSEWSAAGRFADDFNRSMGRTGIRFDNTIRRFRDFATDDDNWERIRDNADRTDRRISALNLTFGRAFGKGSRNNFFNFVGSFVKGMLDIGRLPYMAARSIGEFGNAFADAFSEQQKAGVTGLRGALSALGTALGGPQGIIGTVMALVAAWAVFGKLLPGLVSGVSMVASVLTNFVGAAIIGITGGILALAPAIAAAVAGIGVFAGALMNMPEGTLDRIKAKFEGVKATLSEIGTQIAPKLEQSLDLVVGKLDGLIRNVGGSINTILDDLNRRLASPEMDQFTAAWGQSIPKIVTSLGLAFNALGEGLTAFFVPILPYAERLAENIRLMFERFSAWAKSATGQNAIADFMKTAWRAAESVWGIIKEIGKALGSVFFSAAGVEGSGGETFLEKIERKLRDFNEWLESPEGSAAVKKWFEDGITFAKDLWEVLEDVVGAFDKLDSEEGREALGQILDLFEKITGAIETVAGWTATLSQAWDDFFGKSDFHKWMDENIVEPVKETLDETREKIREWGSETWESFTTWASETGEAIGTFFSELPGKVGEWLSGIGESIATWASGTWESISTWASETSESIGTFFSELPGKVSEWLSGMWESFVESMRQGAIDAMDGLAEALNSLATFITEFSWSETWLAFKAALVQLTLDAIAWKDEQIANIKAWAVGTAAEIVTWAVTTLARFNTWVTETTASIAQWVADIPMRVKTWAAEVGAAIGTWASDTKARIVSWGIETAASFVQWVSDIKAKFQQWKNDVVAAVDSFKTDAVSKFQQWKTEATAKVITALSDIGARLSALPGQVRSWLASLPETLLSPFREGWNRVNTEFQGAPGRLAAAAGAVVSAIAARIRSTIDTLVSPFRNALSSIQGIIRSITSAASGVVSRVRSILPGFASGGVLYGPRVVMAGEDGPEAIVPLNRPLSQVDPSVRALSAIAQGLAVPGGGNTYDNGRSVSIAQGAITVMAPNANPYRVAESVLDHLAEELTG